MGVSHVGATRILRCCGGQAVAGEHVRSHGQADADFGGGSDHGQRQTHSGLGAECDGAVTVRAVRGIPPGVESLRVVTAQTQPSTFAGVGRAVPSNCLIEDESQGVISPTCFLAQALDAGALEMVFGAGE